MEYCIIGIGRFGNSVASELQKNGHDVLVIDKDEQVLRSIANEVAYTMILDATDENALLEASINHFDTVVVGMGESHMNNSILTCMNLQNIGVKNIIAKANGHQHEKVLKKLGVNSVVRPETDMGKRIAHKISNNALLDYIELSDNVRIEGYNVKGCFSKYSNRSIIDINLRKKFGINIVSIKRDDELIIPESNTIILEHDLLIIVGTNENLIKFEKCSTKEKK